MVASCSADVPCAEGQCCVNSTIGALAGGGSSSTKCVNLAEPGEYCHTGKPPHANFCPCKGQGRCEPLSAGNLIGLCV